MISIYILSTSRFSEKVGSVKMLCKVGTDMKVADECIWTHEGDTRDWMWEAALGGI
jgi:hypothetical protein